MVAEMQSWDDLPVDQVIHGDCLMVMRDLPDCSVDAIVTDPPAGISFMGKEWDNFSGKKRPDGQKLKAAAEAEGKWLEGRGTLPYGFGGSSPTAKERDNFISFMTEVMAECLRVIKPGGWAFVWSLPRTSHWTGMALEDAGWEVKECVTHLFGSGFPKSLNVSARLTSLPWCSCGCSQETGTGAEQRPVIATVSEDLTTVNTGSSVLSSDLRLDALQTLERPVLPLEGISTGNGTACIPGPFNGLSTDDTGRFGNENGSSSRHGSSAVQIGIEDAVRQFNPVMFGPSNMAIMAASDEVTHNVGRIQAQPEALWDEMMSNKIGSPSTVSTDTITSDNGIRNSIPSTPLVRPLSPTPSGIALTGESLPVGNGHTVARAIDGSLGVLGQVTRESATANSTSEGGCATLEFHTTTSLEDGSLSSSRTAAGAEFVDSSTSLELAPTVLAQFGNHAHIIRQLVAERKVLVCENCGYPLRPEWVRDGLGSALKPACEFWWLCRKPLSEKSIAQNALTWGCGGLNIDATRVGIETLSYNSRGMTSLVEQHFNYGNRPYTAGLSTREEPLKQVQGRFPSNLLLSHDPRCIARGTKRIKGDHKAGQLIRGKQPDPYGFVTPHVNDRHTDEHGLEEVPAFECVENCPVRILGEQSGERNSHGTAKRATYGGIFGNGKPVTGPIREGDTGSAARYFTQFHPMVDKDDTFNYNVEKTGEVNQCQRLHIHGDRSISEQEDGIEYGVTPESVNNTSNMNTVGSGNKQMDLFQMDAKSITSTTIQQITDLKTSRLLPKNGTTTTTNDLESGTGSMGKGLRSDGASLEMDTGNPLITSISDGQEPITDTASHMPLKSSLNGATRTENTIETITSSGQQRSEQELIPIPEAHISDLATSRYFQQFHDPLETLDAPFHYFSKSSRRDRNSGLEGMPTSASSRYGKMNGTSEHTPKYDTPEQNTHPTCKPTSLISWLCTLITPPDGIILDPFFGSGTLGVCAVRNGFHFIGIEQEQEYVNIARARIAHAQQEARREESEGQEEYICVAGCPIKVLDAQSGISRSTIHNRGKGKSSANSHEGWKRPAHQQYPSTRIIGHDDTGGASRFFQQFPPEPVSLWDEEVAE